MITCRHRGPAPFPAEIPAATVLEKVAFSDRENGLPQPGIGLCETGEPCVTTLERFRHSSVSNAETQMPPALAVKSRLPKTYKIDNCQDHLGVRSDQLVGDRRVPIHEVLR